MKNFNREAIQRMFDGRKGGGGGGTNNADLAGYATQMWVNQNYVSIEFFNRLFSIHGHDPEDESTPPTDISVLPNDMDSIVDSIESMVGFYTEEYLSALGLNPDSGSRNATTLYELLDVKPNSDVSPSRVYGLEGTSADNGKVLTYSTTYGKWIAAANGAGSGSVTSIDMTVPTGFSVSGAPITTYGTLAVTFGGSIAKNKVLASPANATGSPDWRTLVASDIPDLSATYASASDVTTLQGYFDNLGNANSANKLAVYSKTAWGQTYWTSGGVPDNISGDMTSVGDITASSNGTKDIKGFRCLEMYGAASSNFGGYIDFHYNNDSGNYTSRIIEDASGVLKINNTIWATLSGDVGVGTSTTYTKLTVNGGVKTTKLYLYKPNTANDTNAVYFEYDSDNAGVHLVGAGFYGNSYISALGLNPDSGSGNATTLYELLDVKPNSDVSPSRVYGLEGTSADNGKVLTYSTTYGKWIAASNGAGSGSVTSIDMTVPTGFSVSGAPITTYGTLAVTFGGSIAKNKVLASPANATGSPDWRTLVASDIPNLEASKITSGEFNAARIPNLSWTKITTDLPTTLAGYGITDAVKNDTTWWGQTISSGAVKGDLFMISSESGATTNTSSAKLKFNSQVIDGTNAYRSPYIQAIYYGNYGRKRLSVFQSNAQNYTADFNEVLSILPTGSIGIGNTSPSYKLDVNGSIRATSNIYANTSLVVVDSDAVHDMLMTWNTNNGVEYFNMYAYQTKYWNLCIGYHTGTISSGALVLDAVATNWGIGFDSPKTKLDVNGGVKASKFYLVKPNADNDTNAVYLEYDSTNTGVHLVGAGFYSDSYVSAMGVNSNSGGGITLNEPLNGINNAGLSAPTTSGQAVVWNGSAWTYSINTTLRAGTIATTGGATIYGNIQSTSGDFTAPAGHGFKVTGKDNTYILLAGGGTKSIDNFNRIAGYTSLGASSTNTVDLNGVITPGTYTQNGDASTAYITNKPVTTNYSFRLIVEQMAYDSSTYTRQRFQDRANYNVYERRTTNSGSSWTDWTLVQTDLSSYSPSSMVSSIEVGSTSYTPSNGVITLPDYLKLIGGTMTGSITMGTNHYIYGVDETSGSMLHFDGNRTVVGSVGATSTLATHLRSKTGHLTCGTSTTASYTIWDSGNDGSGSGLDADLLDSYHSYAFMRTFVMASGDDYDTKPTQTKGSFVAINSNAITSGITLDDLGAYDTLVSFGYGNRTIQFKGQGWGSTLKYRYIGGSSPYSLQAWKTIAFTDSDITGNAATATSLADTTTDYKAWGQTFFTGGKPATISGNMTGVGTISASGNITVTKDTDADAIVSVTNSNGTVKLYTSTNRGLYDATSGKTGWIIATNGTNTWMSRGNVGVGTTAPAYKLDVSGTFNASGNCTIGGTLGVTSTATANTLTISNTSATAHLSFSRGSINYIRASASGGAIGFVTNGKAAGASANLDMEISNGKVNVNGNVKIDGTLTGCTSIDSLLYFDTTNSRIGVGVSAPDYGIDAIGGMRLRNSTSGTGSFYCGVFSDSNNPYIRMIDLNGSSVDIKIATVTTQQNTIYPLSIGDIYRQTRIIGENVHIYSRVDASSTQQTPAIITTYGGRVIIGSDTTLHTNNADCRMSVSGSLCTAEDDGTFIKIGQIYIGYESSNTALKVYKKDSNNNIIAANFYATGAVSALGANTSSGGAGDYIPLSGSTAITGSLVPATNNNYDLGSSTKTWGTIYANSIAGNASLSVQGISCTTFSTSARAVISSGAKFYSIYIESDSSGNVSSSHSGEINRDSADVHLQYASGTGGVTMCRQGFRFTTSTDGGGNNLSTISTSNRSLRIELGTATLNPYISKPWNEGSDIRRKDIIANVSASIESIADAPIFNFRYKGDLAECVNLGTSAQYWRNVFPCGVTEMGDGYLAMSYGSIALAAAVVTARKVQNHEDRIRELEERLSLSEAENKALREEIELLKAA